MSSDILAVQGRHHLVYRPAEDISQIPAESCSHKTPTHLSLAFRGSKQPRLVYTVRIVSTNSPDTLSRMI